MNKKLLAVALLIAVPNAYAISPIPEETGFSGFVNLGVAGGQVESNTVSKIIGVDLGDDGISNINDGPGEEDVVLPLAAAELSYTFANSGTQIFLGTLLEDFVRFDSSTRFGVRQSLGGAGVASIAALATSPMGAKVWKDPYRTSNLGDRKSTDRTAQGVRLAWGKIFGTGLEVRYSTREQDIDDDQIGLSLVGTGDITLVERQQLNRNGDINRADLRYSFVLGEGSSLDIGASYQEHDLDGDAFGYDGYAGEINWIQKVGAWRFVTNVAYGQFEAEGDNPVYGEAGDFDRVGGSFTAFYAAPFGLKGWNANAGVIYFEEDNDIDFHDQSVGLVQAGMLYRF